MGALRQKRETCVHASDAMRSSRVLDRCQLDRILFEVYSTSARHASCVVHDQRVCADSIFIDIVTVLGRACGVENCVMSVYSFRNMIR
jgi:hypothetical protein